LHVYTCDVHSEGPTRYLTSSSLILQRSPSRPHWWRGITA
jgi:hypothetical protein